MNISEEITVGRMKASYESGNIRGKHDAEKQARIAAFRAIRRAAREAREWDLVMASVQTLEPSIIGDAIRRSIRIAIGSPKT